MQRSKTFTSAVVLGGLTGIAVIVSACAGNDAQQGTQTPSATAYPQGYYPQQQYPQQQYPQQQYPQQQYPQQQYPQQQPQAYPQQPQAYPQQQPTAAPTAPAAGGQMATPGPLAMACTSDAACGLHKCNTQYSKCAFPCASAVDCATGNQCTMGVCTPSLGGH